MSVLMGTQWEQQGKMLVGVMLGNCSLTIGLTNIVIVKIMKYWLDLFKEYLIIWQKALELNYSFPYFILVN